MVEGTAKTLSRSGALPNELPPPFDPALLAVAIYDFQDLTTLKQARAGTGAVTADGDPVRYVADTSGNGNHLVSVTDADVFTLATRLTKKVAIMDYSVNGGGGSLMTSPFDGQAFTIGWTSPFGAQVYEVDGGTTFPQGMFYKIYVCSPAFAPNSAQGVALLAYLNSILPAGAINNHLEIIGTTYTDTHAFQSDPAPGGLRRLKADGQNMDGPPWADDSGDTNIYTVTAGSYLTLDAASTMALIQELSLDNWNGNETAGALFDPSALTGLEAFYQIGYRQGCIPDVDNWPATLQVLFSGGLLGAMECRLPSFVNAPFRNTLTYLNLLGEKHSGTPPNPALFPNIVTWAFEINHLTGDISAFTFPASLLVFTVYGNSGLTGQIPTCTWAGTATSGGNYGDGTFAFWLGQGQQNVDSGFTAGAVDTLSHVTGTAPLYYVCNNTKRNGVLSIANVPCKTTYECSNNATTGWSGARPAKLQKLYVKANSWNAANVNACLAAFIATPSSGFAENTVVIDLSGTGMAAPTGQGITDKAALITRGNSVSTN
jgi:hypothetical protein